MGAQLSEVLNAEVTSGEEGGFSRRRVVKGVAWSVPVIVTAIAAPAAAASGGTTVAFLVPTTVTFSGGNRSGTAPKGFAITNTSGNAITASFSGAIVITPVGTVHSQISVTAAAPSIFAATKFNGNESTTGFTYTGAIPAHGTVEVAFGLGNTENTGSNRPKKTDVDQYSVSMQINTPTSVVSPLAVNLSISYAN